MRTWRRTTQEELKKAGKTWFEVSRFAQDNVAWTTSPIYLNVPSKILKNTKKGHYKA